MTKHGDKQYILNAMKRLLVRKQNFTIFFSDPIDFSIDPWPKVDDEGYYQSYKEGNKWVNYWYKNRPSGPTVMSGFLTSKDESNVNHDNKIDTHLPVVSPYWTKQSVLENETEPQFGTPGIRATWIGHATVLAEVDEAIVICDPIFRYKYYLN